MRNLIDIINEFQMFDIEKIGSTDGGSLPPVPPGGGGGGPWDDGDGEGAPNDPIDPDYQNGVDFHSLDAFTQGYFEAMIFTTEDEAREAGYNCYLSSIYYDSVATGVRQCHSFRLKNADLLHEAYDTVGYDEGHAGHDFWLTRNGHGAGFWDRGLGEVGENLLLRPKSSAKHMLTLMAQVEPLWFSPKLRRSKSSY
jgi:hypothetical protein